MEDVSDLKSRLAFELNFLEQLYWFSVVDEGRSLSVELRYTADAKPRLRGLDRANLMLSDWRPGFMSVGGPLIFSTAFKIIDLIVEWMLSDQPGKHLQFKQKLALIDKLSQPDIPHLFDQNGWLFTRFKALYGRGAIVRNALLHQGGVRASPSAFFVQSRGANSPLEIRSEEVAALSGFSVAIARLLLQSRQWDDFENLRVAHLLDKLISVHGEDRLGKPTPRVGRAYLSGKCDDAEFFAYSLENLSMDFDRDITYLDRDGNQFVLPGTKTFFDLDLSIETGSGVLHCVVPWSDLKNRPLGISVEDARRFCP